MAVVARESAWPALALVRREFLTELRRPRAFGVIFGFALVALSVAALNWPSNVYSLRLASFFANEFFQGIALALFGVVLLCVPALSAGAIVAEREQETFDLIRMSLISSTGYVAAKLLNGCGLFFTIVAGLTPILATVFFLAGVETARVAAVLVMLAATGVSVTAVSLLCSAVCRRTMAAVVASYAGIGTLSIAPVVVAFFALAALNVAGFSIRSFQGTLSEVFSTFSLLGAFLAALEGRIQGAGLLPPILVQLAVSAVCLAIAVRRVQHPPAPPVTDEERPIDDPDVLRARRRSFPYYLIDPLKKRPPVEDSRNPMLIREVRWGIMNRGTMLVRLFYVSISVYFFAAATVLTLRARGTDIRPWIVAQIVMTLCVAPALLANAFTKERELSNFDMLRMTLLRGRDIVYGKLLSGAVTLVPVVVAAIVSVLPLYGLAGLRDVTPVVMGYVTLIACAALALSLSLLGSLFAPRTSAAIALSYGLVAIAFVGSWFGITALANWLDREAGLAAYVSPVTAYLSSVDYSAGRREYTLAVGPWLASVAATLAVSALLVRFVVWFFERYRVTDP